MKFSVIIPTLGERKKEIKKLLNSISVQEVDKEVIIISQDNHNIINDIMAEMSDLDIIHISTSRKGLSYARNIGLRRCSGEIIILSDDDCWYKQNAFITIETIFKQSKNIQIVLTQIYDFDNNKLYKNYPKKSKIIKGKSKLMSKSSIEIAFLSDVKIKKFDETFGLGAYFVCGEEIDFLLNNYSKNNIYYASKVTVYHPKKFSSSKKQIVAKGGVYAKHYSMFTCMIVLIRDLLIKRENNFSFFIKGFKEERAIMNGKKCNI